MTPEQEAQIRKKVDSLLALRDTKEVVKKNKITQQIKPVNAFPEQPGIRVYPNESPEQHRERLRDIIRWRMDKLAPQTETQMFASKPDYRQTTLTPEQVWQRTRDIMEMSANTNVDKTLNLITGLGSVGAGAAAIYGTRKAKQVFQRQPLEGRIYLNYAAPLPMLVKPNEKERLQLLQDIDDSIIQMDNALKGLKKKGTPSIKALWNQPVDKYGDPTTNLMDIMYKIVNYIHEIKELRAPARRLNHPNRLIPIPLAKQPGISSKITRSVGNTYVDEVTGEIIDLYRWYPKLFYPKNHSLRDAQGRISRKAILSDIPIYEEIKLLLKEKNVSPREKFNNLKNLITSLKSNPNELEKIGFLLPRIDKRINFDLKMSPEQLERLKEATPFRIDNRGKILDISKPAVSQRTAVPEFLKEYQKYKAQAATNPFKGIPLTPKQQKAIYNTEHWENWATKWKNPYKQGTPEWKKKEIEYKTKLKDYVKGYIEDVSISTKTPIISLIQLTPQEYKHILHLVKKVPKHHTLATIDNEVQKIIAKKIQDPDALMKGYKNSPQMQYLNSIGLNTKEIASVWQFLGPTGINAHMKRFKTQTIPETREEAANDLRAMIGVI